MFDEEDPVPQASIEVEVAPKKPKIPSQKPSASVKQGTKRSQQGDKSQPRKRQKKEETPSDLSDLSEDEPSEESFEESAVSDFEDSDSNEAPKRKRQSKSKSKTPIKRNSKQRVVSEGSEDHSVTEDSLTDAGEESDAASTPPKKAPAARKAKNEIGNKRKSLKSVVESEDSENEQEKRSSPAETLTRGKSVPKKTAPVENAEEKAKANDSDSSEMSVVIDEPPKAKQKRRSKPEIASRESKPPKGVKSKKESKPTKDLTTNEAEIKTLQSQLVKCGVRKIWAFELKQYGDDSKAKIGHLKAMLRDIGMTGRFSDQRAREIKELRELQADVEAVKEGESKWGLESGRRNRGQRKSFKEVTDEEDEDNEDSEDEKRTRSRSLSEKPLSKVEKAKQEFAFLGDDGDESDSD